jgi:hypothetical protein
MGKFFILFSCILTFCAGISAQDPVKISPLSGLIDFDGKPSETAWQSCTDFPLVMHFPVYGNNPTEKSIVRIGFDKDFLWVGASLYYKDISQLVSTSKKRDETSENSDSFGILLDTFDDNENALAFSTMPSGLKIDYSIANDAAGGGGPDEEMMNYTWNSFWDVKTSRDGQAWYIEMRIPFSSLRFQSTGNLTKMGLIITRTISHCNETDTYPAIDTKYGLNGRIKPSLAQTVVVEGIKPRNPLYISPFVIGGFTRNRELNENNDQYIKNDDATRNMGVDLKYNLKGNLTLDFTANTDFAQVEADDEQVNLTRYSLFFPEKRLFFQERSSIFSFGLGGPQDLFYSRNIGIADGEPVRILGGGRLVGRLGKWDIGFLDMNTAKFNGNPAENFSVARARKQIINENSYVGGMIVSRLGFDGNYNVAYGLDGIVRVFNDDYLELKLAQTVDNQISSKVASLDPTYFTLKWERRSEEGFGYEGLYAYWGKDFRPESGFMYLNNLHEVRGSMQYGWFPGQESGIFNYRTGVDFEMLSRIQDGNIENLEVSPEFEVNFKSGFGTFITVSYNKEGVLEEHYLTEKVNVPAGNYAFWGIFGMFNTPKTKLFSTMVGYETGGFYDGNRFSLDVMPELNLSSSLQLSASYRLDKVRFPDRNQKFTNNIARVKVTYMFNTKISASSYIQLNESDNVLITNFRLRYNPKDGNDFYLVFNDLRLLNKTSTAISVPSFLNRTILLKYTHTFVL